MIQLRRELDHVKRQLKESNSIIRECRKGFQTIDETGNVRIARVFYEELKEL